MSRHYSKVLLELPDCPSDPQELVITIECDQCGGRDEWRTNIVHLGTLVRVLNDAWASLGQDDDGTMEKFTEFVPSESKARVMEHLRQYFPQWKQDRKNRRAAN